MKGLKSHLVNIYFSTCTKYNIGINLIQATNIEIQVKKTVSCVSNPCK